MAVKTSKHTLLIIVLIIFFLLSTLIIIVFWPRYELEFIELGLLGKDKQATDYFFSDTSTVPLNIPIDWNIYIHNHMVNSQDIIIKIKLLNSTMQTPNNQKQIPSPYDSITDLPIFLKSNETLIVPISWSIDDLVFDSGLIILTRLIINDQKIPVNISTLSDSFFRMVFELWVFNQSLNEYQFGWYSGEEISSSSIYMGFRAES
jgi:hypothetical protein